MFSIFLRPTELETMEVGPSNLFFEIFQVTNDHYSLRTVTWVAPPNRSTTQAKFIISIFQILTLQKEKKKITKIVTKYLSWLLMSKIYHFNL